MNAYPDTSFLCASYRTQDNSEAADDYFATMSEPLQVTALLEFEFLQSIRLQVWLHSQDKSKGYSQTEADMMIADWEADIATGTVQIVASDASAVLRQAASLSRSHTTKGGHRTLDVLHVATAVHLGAKEFLTFDTRQKKLAKAAGLATPL